MPSIQPFTILALASFGPVAAQGYKPRLVETDLYTLDQALARMAPRFWVELPKDVCPEAGLDVAVSAMAGFKPENVVKNTPYLAALDACRSYLAQARAAGTPPDKAAAEIRAQWPGLPLDLSLPQAARKETAGTGALDDILSMVAVAGTSSPAGRSLRAGRGGRPRPRPCLRAPWPPSSRTAPSGSMNPPGAEPNAWPARPA